MSFAESERKISVRQNNLLKCKGTCAVNAHVPFSLASIISFVTPIDNMNRERAIEICQKEKTHISKKKSIR